MHKKKIFFSLIAFFVHLEACDKKSSSNTTPTIPPRSGGLLEATPTKYNDIRPTLSTDGTKLVYISGRDSTDNSATLKAYKAIWLDGTAPETPTRLSKVDLGVEKDVSVSPNGQHTVLTVLINGKTYLYYQDFLGTNSPLKLTEGEGTPTNVIWSADSKILLWVSKVANKSQIKAFEIGEGTYTTLSANRSIDVGSAVDSSIQTQAFWAAGANTTYRLISTEPGPNGSTMQILVERKFNTFAELASVSKNSIDLPAPYDKGIQFKPRVALQGASSMGLIVREVLASSGKTIDRIGDYEMQQGEVVSKVHVLSEPSILDLNAKTVGPLADAAILGYDILSADISVDAFTGLLVSRHLYRCNGDESDRYGISLLLGQLDVKKVTALTLRLQSVTTAQDTSQPEDWSFLIGEGYCSRQKPDKSGNYRLDDQIISAALNSGATKDKYRVAFVSRFSPRFDNQCQLKIGDPEVRVIDVRDNVQKVYEVLPNRAPLVDDDRGGQDACVL